MSMTARRPATGPYTGEVEAQPLALAKAQREADGRIEQHEGARVERDLGHHRPRRGHGSPFLGSVDVEFTGLAVERGSD